MSKLCWSKLAVTERDVSLARVLRCGQTFRWKNIDGVWSCSLSGRIIFLKQDPLALYYSSVGKNGAEVDAEDKKTVDIINDYFNLSVDLPSLYQQWSKADAHFERLSEKFNGIRILRQDPWENLISFICSSNNNVKRISQMCENLCVHFGELIGEHEGIQYYDFPTPSALAHDSVEEKLRSLGFGYRAKYIQKTALLINTDENGLESLKSLRGKPYKEAHSELLKFTGVGPKVADCVCLMSLDKHDVVPVDTHVYQIAKRDYKFKSKGDTVTKAVYENIGDFFRDLFGSYAGWAHSILFANDLGDLNNGLNKTTVTVEKITVIKTETKIKKEMKNGKELVGVPERQVLKRLIEETSIKVEEIEYSNTGRPKRTKKQKTEY